MTAISIQQLWVNGLLMIPAAAVAWMLCRGLRLRAATRHATWLIVLSLLALPSLMLRVVPDEMREHAARLAQSLTTSVESVDVERPRGEYDDPVPQPDSAAEESEREPSDHPSIDYPWRPRSLPHRWMEQVFPLALSSGEMGGSQANSADNAEFDAGTLHADRAATPTDLPPSNTGAGEPADTWLAFHDSESASPDGSAGETASEIEALLSNEQPAGDAPGSGPSVTSAYVADLITGASALRDAFVRLPALPGRIWISGALLVGVLLAARLVRMRALVREAGPAPAHVIDILERAARRIELASPPETRMTSAEVPPMIWCARRPILVLPKDLWRQLDDASRLAVIFHELAHLKRRDHVLCWMEMLSAIMFWWNPAVWWVCRQIRDEADACCDAWVVRLQPTGRRAYAQALLASTQMNGRVAFAGPVVGLGSLSPRTRRLARRLTMVMTEPLRPGLSLRGMACVGALAATACLVAPIAACPPEDESARQKAEEFAAAEALLEAQLAEEAGALEEAASTYEAYVRDRDSLAAQEYRDALTAYTVASLADPLNQDDVDARLDRLEARLDHIAAMLEHLGMRGAGAPEHSTSDFAAEMAPRESAPAFGGDDVITRTYALPEGKLRELTDLMVLQEVPIFVTPRLEEGLIDVHATPGQHEIFGAFLSIIHPDGVKVLDEAGEPQSKNKEGAETRAKSHDEALHQKKEQLAAELDAAKQRANGHDSHARDLEAELEKIEAEIEALEDKAESASGDEKKKINDHIKTLKQQMREFEQKAREQEREKEKAERTAEDLEATLESIEEELETLEELAEADLATQSR